MSYFRTAGGHGEVLPELALGQPGKLAHGIHDGQGSSHSAHDRRVINSKLFVINRSNELVTKYAEHLYQEFNKEKPAFSVLNIVAFTDENVERCFKTVLSE